MRINVVIHPDMILLMDVDGFFLNVSRRSRLLYDQSCQMCRSTEIIRMAMCRHGVIVHVHRPPKVFGQICAAGVSG